MIMRYYLGGERSAESQTMSLQRRVNAPFIAGVIAASQFLVTGMLDAVPAGNGLVCLIGLIQGALLRPELVPFAAGVLGMMVIGSGLRILLGNSISAGVVMVPFLTAFILFYAIGAFFISLMVSRLLRFALDRTCGAHVRSFDQQYESVNRAVSCLAVPERLLLALWQGLLWVDTGKSRPTLDSRPCNLQC